MRTSGGLSALLGVLLRSLVCRVWACPGVPGPRSGRARSGLERTAQCTSGRSRAPRPPPLPLLPTFSQLSELLHSAPRSASLMNYSAARDPISAPRPPRPIPGWGRLPQLPRAPPSSARRRLAQSRPPPAQPGGPAPFRSLPPAPASTRPAGAERSRPAARAAPLRGGG